MESDLLSSKEVADILKISRNTVYELIKRGELTSSKVGKQVRISKSEVETYLGGNEKNAVDDKSVLTKQEVEMRSNTNLKWNKSIFPSTGEDFIRGNEFIICGQDIALDLLVNYFEDEADLPQLYRSYLTSYNGIFALYQGKVHAATAHLWDGDTDEYNVSYVKKMLPGIPALLIRIGKRQQGFYVKKGNPKEILGWDDLKRTDISIVNREKGSGTRVLLDEKIRLMGILGEYIDGYFNECKSHLAVASIVARGEADVGLGSQSGLMNVSGVDFIPLQTECYDVIMRLADADKAPNKKLMEILTSEKFKKDLQVLDCYDTQETGRVILGE